MKSIKHLLFAITASLLLAAGLARAAESFDAVASHSQVQRVNDGGSPGGNCIVLQ